MVLRHKCEKHELRHNSNTSSATPSVRVQTTNTNRCEEGFGAYMGIWATEDRTTDFGTVVDWSRVFQTQKNVVNSSVDNTGGVQKYRRPAASGRHSVPGTPLNRRVANQRNKKMSCFICEEFCYNWWNAVNNWFEKKLFPGRCDYVAEGRSIRLKEVKMSSIRHCIHVNWSSETNTSSKIRKPSYIARKTINSKIPNLASKELRKDAKSSVCRRKHARISIPA